MAQLSEYLATSTGANFKGGFLIVSMRRRNVSHVMKREKDILIRQIRSLKNTDSQCKTVLMNIYLVWVS